MAQKVQVLLTDDLDGSEATQTIRFGWGGTAYEIDLNEKNSAALEKALTKYVAVARKVGNAKAGRSSSPKRQAVALDLAEVRAWARDQGHDVSDRGRVSRAVLDAYKQATGQ